MADQGAPMDFPAHERGYDRFIRMARVGAIACFIIACFVVFLISR